MQGYTKMHNFRLRANRKFSPAENSLTMGLRPMDLWSICVGMPLMHPFSISSIPLDNSYWSDWAGPLPIPGSVPRIAQGPIPGAVYPDEPLLSEDIVWPAP